jgi:hypothetical protein
MKWKNDYGNNTDKRKDYLFYRKIEMYQKLLQSFTDRLNEIKFLLNELKQK